MLPVLLAMLSRLLPSSIIAAGHGGTSNPAKRRMVIDGVDKLVLEQVPELAAIPAVKRHRYARSLLAAMIEDKLITFRSLGAADGENDDEA